ncbi:MAG: SDR family NAD(P)-dependent oxidoreductase [Bryobacteraceae bacterium]
MSNTSEMFRLDGRVAMVVGAASGIGRAGAIGLAQAGAMVICADVNADGVQSVCAEIQAEPLVMDITDPASVESGVAQVRKNHPQIDVLVCTPAVNVRKPLLSYTGDEFDKVLRLNLRGTFNITQAVARIMSEQKRGSIILLSSIRSLTVEPGQGVYAATKAATVQMARGFASELGSAGVRVNCIAPGVVETPLTAPIKSKPDWYRAYADRNALGRWASPSEMAGPIVFLASDASSYVTGAVLFVDGGWTAIDGRFTPPL